MLKKILIVDDSEPLHQIYKVTVRRYKCETIPALSREEGLEKLIEHPDVDLILLDLDMPLSRMSALEFIKKVREREAFANVPIIAITIREKSYPPEVLGFAAGNIVKPFTSNEVHKVIEKVFPEALSA